MREPLVVHERMNTVQVLEQLRRHPIPLAVVVDEFGDVEGIVTASDILASIAGDLADTADHETPDVICEGERVWLLNGSLLLEEVREVLQCHTLPRGKRHHTLAGLVLDQLGQIPGGGEKFALEGYQFEVVSMDGHRISRVRVRQNTASEMTPSVGQTSG
jgi:CBS domain containing-hemolysin-like protein